MTLVLVNKINRIEAGQWARLRVCTVATAKVHMWREKTVKTCKFQKLVVSLQHECQTLIAVTTAVTILCLVFGAILMRKGKEEEERRERNRQRHREKVGKGGN